MNLLFLLLLMEPPVGNKIVRETFSLPLPDSVYTPISMAATETAFFILDDRSYALAKIDREGNLIAKREGEGQAPGEFILPYSVGVGGGKVFVGDFRFVHVFSEDNLKYITRFRTFNNTMVVTFKDDELFLGTIKYPDGKHSCYVFTPEGKELRSLYEHGIDDPDAMNLAFFDQGSDGTLYFLQEEHYRVDILDRQGNTVKEIQTQPPPNYKESVPYAPYQKKYGMNMSAYKHWQTAWHMPKGIAVERDRFLWLCFSELEKDLQTYRYYLEVYDLESGRKICSWKKMPGRLFDGGDHAYFIEERDSRAKGDYDLRIVGYSTAE